MGQKVNPIGLRLGINRTWDSRWYAKGNSYTKLLGEDLNIKAFLKEKLKSAAALKQLLVLRVLLVYQKK